MAGRAAAEKNPSEIARHAMWKVSEAALILRCTQTTIRRELKRGTIRGVRIGGEWRIPSVQFSLGPEPAEKLEEDQLSANRATPSDRNDPSRFYRPRLSDSEATSEVSAVQHTLRLNLLGRPQIYIDGMRIVELERSNRRSQVIQLLALNRAGLSAEKLASSLSIADHQYEDESLHSHYVRSLVWGTRDQARKRTGWGGIICSPVRSGAGLHHYQLPNNTCCDVWEFEDKLDDADRLLIQAVALPMSTEAKSDLLDRAATLREQAVQLYKGEFCEGSTNGSVVQAARVFEERYLRATLQQGDYWRAKGLTPREAQTTHIHGWQLDNGRLSPEIHTAWREALRNYERVLAVDNYHEEAYIRAMECYAYLGNSRGVDQMFFRCQEVLYADLLQLPGEEVVRTYQQCKTWLSTNAVAFHGLNSADRLHRSSGRH